MKSILTALAMLTMCSCTMFRKDSGNDEMEKMSEMVLKKNEGIDIQMKPIPTEKNKA